MHPLSLDNVTIASATPPEMVRLAARLGCAMVNLRIGAGAVSLPLACDYLGDPTMRREMRALLADTGVVVGIVEACPLTPEARPEGFDRLLDAAAEIGALRVNVLGEDPDPARRRERFAAFTAHAAQWGLGVTLEFMRRSCVKTLAAALDMVRAAPGATVMVDALHVVRNGVSVAELAATPAELIGWAQLNDGPAEASEEYMLTEGRFNRLLPGEGAFPLAAIMGALPDGVPIGVEVPNRARQDAGLDNAEWAALVVARARDWAAQAGVALAG